MVPCVALEMEHLNQDTGINPADHPSDVSRSRSRRKPTTSSSPGYLVNRFDIERPLYLNDNEFGGGPNILIADVEGQSRPAHDGDYRKGLITGSESRGSEEASSIHEVEDLGFEAAATYFPEFSYRFTDYKSVISSSHSTHSQKPPESASVQSCLKDKIEKALVWSQLDRGEYLPLDSFELIFDIKSIVLLLNETCDMATHKDMQEKFTSIVDVGAQRSRRRILAVLVFMSRVRHIEHFIREDIWDDELPLERSTGGSKGSVKLRSSENRNLMENWSRDDIELFGIYQKMIFVPFFDIQENRLCSYEFESNVRLPWKVFEHKTSGGFGVVHKVEIHPSHHNCSQSDTSGNPVFALKAIEAGDHKAYREELSALERTCAQVQKEKHLIKLLLTFRHGDKFYLLFEWADGNLEEFWKRRSARSPTALPERWAAEQCLGLARAVNRIHGLTTWQKKERSSSGASLTEAERDWGRHGDIKPENILWFKEHGKDHNLLVMSDLGLTRYHSRFSKSFVPRSHIDGCSWAYRPPELDIDERISQKYDIWSLGCVFLEFCVWYLQGHDEVLNFSFERIDEDVITYEGVQIEKFFNIEKSEGGQKRPHLKKVVEERLRVLKDLGTQTVFAKELLHVIEHKMLQCAPDNRGKIDIICTDLSRVLSSLPNVTNPEELSQDLAYITRDESAPSLGAPSNISWHEEPRDATNDSPHTPDGDESDTGLMMRTRSQRLRRENSERSEGHHDHVSSTDAYSISKTLAANVVAAASQNEMKDQSLEKITGSKHMEALRKDATGSHIPNQSPMTTRTTRTNRTKDRISQKSKKWFQEPLNHLIHMWKG